MSAPHRTDAHTDDTRPAGPRLTPDEAVAVRERYEFLRSLDQAAADQPGAATDDAEASAMRRDNLVAAEFGLSRTTVRSIVLGRTHRRAGGPVDTERIDALAKYREEVVTLGVTEARRRRQLRGRGVDPEESLAPVQRRRLVQRLRIVGADGKMTGMEYVLPFGHAVLVDVVPEDEHLDAEHVAAQAAADAERGVEATPADPAVAAAAHVADVEEYR